MRHLPPGRSLSGLEVYLTFQTSKAGESLALIKKARSFHFNEKYNTNSVPRMSIDNIRLLIMFFLISESFEFCADFTVTLISPDIGAAFFGLLVN